MKARIIKYLRAESYRRKLRHLSTYINSFEFKSTEISPCTKALVLSPHPDDESIGCGGTIRLIIEKGGKVDILQMTKGENAPLDDTIQSKEQMANTREAEAKNACQILGVQNRFVLSGTDGQLENSEHIVADITEHLSQNDYDLILCPWPHDQHKDHQVCFKHFTDAIKASHNNTSIWLYEVWTPLHPNTAVDISSTIDTKKQAISAYQSQIKQINYVETALALSKYRSMLIPGSRSCEAFIKGNANLISQLTC